MTYFFDVVSKYLDFNFFRVTIKIAYFSEHTLEEGLLIFYMIKN